MSQAMKCDHCGTYGEVQDAYDRPYAWLHVERSRVHFGHEPPAMDFCSSTCTGAYFTERAEQDADLENRRP